MMMVELRLLWSTGGAVARTAPFGGFLWVVLVEPWFPPTSANPVGGGRRTGALEVVLPPFGGVGEDAVGLRDLLEPDKESLVNAIIPN